MSSNIKIKRICSFCGKEFIAQKQRLNLVQKDAQVDYQKRRNVKRLLKQIIFASKSGL